MFSSDSAVCIVETKFLETHSGDQTNLLFSEKYISRFWISKTLKIRPPYACSLILFVDFPGFSEPKTAFFELLGFEKGGVYIFNFFHEDLDHYLQNYRKMKGIRTYIMMLVRKRTFKEGGLTSAHKPGWHRATPAKILFLWSISGA